MKDFSNLEKYILENGTVKTAQALSLGYTQYDLKGFLAGNMLERVERGVYRIPLKEEVKTLSYVDRKKIEYEGIGNIFKGDFSAAISKFDYLISVCSDFAYYDLIDSYARFLDEDYEGAYEYLISTSRKNGSKSYSLALYAIVLVLKRYRDIDESVIKELKGNIEPDALISTFYNKVCRPLEKENYALAQKNMYYFLVGDKKKKQFRIGNQYVYNALVDLMEKLGIERYNSKKEETTAVVVPDVSEKQVLLNSILLNAIEDKDYDKVIELVSKYELSDSREVIVALIEKIKEISSMGVKTGVSKVVAAEDAMVIEQKGIVTENILGEDSIKAAEEQPVAERVEVPEVVEVPEQKPVSAAVVEVPQPVQTHVETVVEKSAPVTADDTYQLYLDDLQNCDFDMARRHLIQYDTIMKRESKYRNIKYHFSRIERAKKEYEEDPEKYLIKRERMGTALTLFKEKNYDEALRVLDEIPKCLEALLLRATIYIQLKDYSMAIGIASGIKNSEEPDYYRIMANIEFYRRNYEESLGYAIKYNECRPQSSAYIYSLMANCYEKLRKPAKAIKALRVVDQINKKYGIDRDISSRISFNEKLADRNRSKRLSLATGINYDEE